MEEYYGLGVSLGYIVTTAIGLRLLRLILLPFISSQLVKSLFLEFLATFELCATAFELGIVLMNDGFIYYGGLLIILLNYWGSVWPPAITAPHPHILDIIRRKRGMKLSLLKIVSQLLASLIVFTLYVKPIWNFGYREEHLKKVAETRCYSNLKLTMEYGILAEFLMTFGFLMTGKLLGPKPLRNWTVPTIFVGIKRIGMKYTGAFMNPILASTIQFGCEGVNLKDHLLVYWSAPTLALLLFQLLSSSSSNATPKDEDKSKTKVGQKQKKKPKKE